MGNRIDSLANMDDTGPYALIVNSLISPCTWNEPPCAFPRRRYLYHDPFRWVLLLVEVQLAEVEAGILSPSG